MKKLEDFQCEKVEINNIYGGKMEEMTIIYSGTEVCEVRGDDV